MEKLFNKLLILRTPGIGPVRYNELVARFDGDVTAAVGALNPSAAHRDVVSREMERAAALDIHYICDDDDYYPAQLLNVRNHPPVITARGNLDTLRRTAVSMVGTPPPEWNLLPIWQPNLHRMISLWHLEWQ